MENLVTDISIVAGWNPRIKDSPAEVFIYTKITPQPAAKVSLLHLQSLVVKTTLLRVIPLLPDGTSPRESPGIRALGIPVVAGRNRTVPQTPVNQRRFSEATLDGVESVTSCDAERALQGGGSPPDDAREEEGVESVGERVVSFNRGLLTPKVTPRSRIGIPDVSQKCEEGSSDERTEDLFCTPFKKIKPSKIITLSGEFVPPEAGIGYFRDSDGFFKQAEFCDWQSTLGRSNNSWNPTVPRNNKRKPRVCSINAIERELSPMTESTLKRIVELNALVADMNIGEDGASEDSEAVLRSSKIAAGNATAAKSSAESNTMIAIEGEMAPQETAQRDDDIVIAANGGDGCEDEQAAVCSETTMIIEKDTLCIVFPKRIRSDAVVIEIIIVINPLYIEGKAYATFILAGLPHCENGAYINFRIDDEDNWKFHTFPALNTTETEGSEDNKLHGVLDLNLKSNPNHLDRSIVIRTIRCPMVLEVLGFEMKTNVQMHFSWSPMNEQVTGGFEIDLSFSKVESDEDAKRSLINLFLINGPERQNDLKVETPEGCLTDFSLGDREIQNHEISARRCRLLRVERLTKDVDRPLRIKFNKQFTSVTQDVGIPLVRIGGDTTILEESVTIMNAKLPLEVTFSPNSKSWKHSKRLDNNNSKTYTRKEINMREPNPYVSISCLRPAVSPTAEAMNLALMRGHGEFIDRIDYKIEESECLEEGEEPMIVVKLSLELAVPPGVEPMGEIVRFHSGSFAFQFATINGELTGKGVMFEDSDELILLNFGILDSTKGDERLLISAEWFGEQGLTLSCGEITEFRLPRATERVVGKTVFECADTKASILSLQLSYQHKATYGFTKGKAIILGMDTDKSEIFFHIPRKSPCNSLYASLVATSSVYGTSTSSSRSLRSLVNQEQRKAPARGTVREHRDALIHWMWEMKETLILLLVIWLLCVNMMAQAARNAALRASLRQTTIMLEHLEISRDQEVAQKRLGSYMQTPDQPRGGVIVPEDTWWQVVGLEGTKDSGQFRIGFLKMDTRNSDRGRTCDLAGAGDNYDKGDTEPDAPATTADPHGDATAPVSEAPKEEKEDGKEFQKRVALLLQETWSERTHRLVANLLGLFWRFVMWRGRRLLE